MKSSSRDRAGVFLATVVTVFFACGSLHAQRREISVEFGGSAVRPPVGVEGDPARFLVTGIRAVRQSRGGTGFQASVLAGYSLDDQGGGNFLSGTVEGSAWHSLGEDWSVGLEARGFGFHVSAPFPYRALAVEGESSLRFTGPNLLATLSGVAGQGWSRTELLRSGQGGVGTVEDRLWRYGATGEVLVGAGVMWAGVSGGIHESLGGSYRSGGLRILVTGGGPAVEARVDAWRTPAGAETIAGLALILPWGGWSLRGFLGKTEPDPLTLAEPSAGAGGLLLGRRLLGIDPLRPPPPPVHEVLHRSGDRATDRIKIKGPAGVREVKLLGDFTYWEPMAMTRDGEEWVAEVEMESGVYHFGFLADEEWYIPEGAPDLVSDEWGRKNATLVIEG